MLNIKGSDGSSLFFKEFDQKIIRHGPEPTIKNLLEVDAGLPKNSGIDITSDKLYPDSFYLKTAAKRLPTAKEIAINSIQDFFLCYYNEEYEVEVGVSGTEDNPNFCYQLTIKPPKIMALISHHSMDLPLLLGERFIRRL